MDEVRGDDSTPAFDGDLPGVLSREQLSARIMGPERLIEGWLDLEAQLQPNGFDLTLRGVSRYRGAGAIATDNTRRVLPELEEVPFGPAGWLDLAAGGYHIVYNEIVNLPNDLMALARPRSSLARCGVAIHTAVWDAGYRGRSTSLLVVTNLAGFRVERNARVLQMVFFGLAHAAKEGYRGVYQGENIG